MDEDGMLIVDLKPWDNGRAKYRNKDGYLAHLRKLVKDHGPKYLRTYNVQNHLGKKGRSLYATGRHYFGDWATAVDVALSTMGMTYRQDVVCARPWEFANQLKTHSAA